MMFFANPAHRNCDGLKTGKGFPVVRKAFSRMDLPGFHVGCGKALLTLQDIEAYTLTLLKGLEAVILNSTEVNEHVLAFIAFDESKALALIEPLDFAF
jgi:hypothetical protein